MRSATTICSRDKRKALVAAIAMPGLGQCYNGEFIKGICFFSLFIVLPISLLRLSIALQDLFLMAGIIISLLCLLGLYGFSVIDAYRTAKTKGEGYMVRSYNRWYVYLLFWCAAAFWINRGFADYAQRNILMFCRIATGSMEPAVTKGDYVIFDNTKGGRSSPKKDAVVLFLYPDDRSKLYVKRVAGLPGDTLLIDGMTQVIVPHGHIFVLGDNREHAEDSRDFGPVPLADVMGRARLIYFSVDSEGIRWERIGKRL